MMSKYALAKSTIQSLSETAQTQGIEVIEAKEAMMISLVQDLKDCRGAEFIRTLLQYEIDNLNSGGNFDIVRGMSHS